MSTGLLIRVAYEMTLDKLTEWICLPMDLTVVLIGSLWFGKFDGLHIQYDEDDSL